MQSLPGVGCDLPGVSFTQWAPSSMHACQDYGCEVVSDCRYLAKALLFGRMVAHDPGGGEAGRDSRSSL